ncbi:MAG: glycosyltransferase [Tenuifilaceae bacterium]
MDEEKRYRVLVCPLGWGLGHASRLIPIIARLQKEGFEVITAGDELQIQFISSFFPDIKTINFQSFKVRLSKGSSQLFPILGISVRLPYHIIREHFTLKRIVKEHGINLIISDNRYGLWHKNLKTVIITHQLRVLFPKPFRFLEPVGELFVRYFAQKFTYCWIPDFPEEINLAGKLSHPSKTPLNSRYIGLLSRFNDYKNEYYSHAWDLVGIVSGPSPQREILINSIAHLAKQKNLKTLIIKGNPDDGTTIIENDGVYYAGHLNDNDFVNAIKSTKYLITRAGYSTIMDLSALGVSGLIVPTPGQTEQEYLAEYLSKKGIFKACKQKDLINIDISLLQIIQNKINRSPQLLEKSFQELFYSV